MRPKTQIELQSRNRVSGIEKCTPRTYGEYDISASRIRPGDFRKIRRICGLGSQIEKRDLLDKDSGNDLWRS